MLVNLLPDFLAVLNSSDRVAAYHRYYETHRHRLAAYWNNYVLDPETPHFSEVARMAALSDRTDLLSMLERTDVVALARGAEAQCSSSRDEASPSFAWNTLPGFPARKHRALGSIRN